MRRNGESILEIRVIKKILQSLIPKYRIVEITIKKSKDLEQMPLEQLMGSLQAYEERLREDDQSVHQVLQTKLTVHERKNKSSCGSWQRNRGCERGKGDKNQGRKHGNEDYVEGSSHQRGRGRGHGQGRGRGRYSS